MAEAEGFKPARTHCTTWKDPSRCLQRISRNQVTAARLWGIALLFMLNTLLGHEGLHARKTDNWQQALTLCSLIRGRGCQQLEKRASHKYTQVAESDKPVGWKEAKSCKHCPFHFAILLRQANSMNVPQGQLALPRLSESAQAKLCLLWSARWARPLQEFTNRGSFWKMVLCMRVAMPRSECREHRDRSRPVRRFPGAKLPNPAYLRSTPVLQRISNALKLVIHPNRSIATKLQAKSLLGL